MTPSKTNPSRWASDSLDALEQDAPDASWEDGRRADSGRPRAPRRIGAGSARSRCSCGGRCCRHGWMAPSASERLWSGTIRSGSNSSMAPSPSHAGHAPYGELNEKRRGSSSSMLHSRMVRAREPIAEASLRPALALLDQHDQLSLAQLQRDLDRLGETLAHFGCHDHAIHHRLDRVLLVAAEAERIVATFLQGFADIHDGRRSPGLERSPACADPRSPRGGSPSFRGRPAPRS